MRSVIAFLVNDCCDGHPELCNLVAADAARACCTPEGSFAEREEGRQAEELICEARPGHSGGWRFRPWPVLRGPCRRGRRSIGSASWSTLLDDKDLKQMTSTGATMSTRLVLSTLAVTLFMLPRTRFRPGGLRTQCRPRSAGSGGCDHRRLSSESRSRTAPSKSSGFSLRSTLCLRCCRRRASATSSFAATRRPSRSMARSPAGVVCGSGPAG